jgi:DNA-binding MarR family transcriptional regulator
MSDRTANLLGALVTALGDRLAGALAAEAGQHGGTPAALVQLAEHPGLTIDELRRRLGLSHSTVVRLVDRLVTRGLVTRTAHERDARAVRLTLTEPGHAAAASVAEARLDVLRAAVDHLPAKRRSDLEHIAEELLLALPTSLDDSSRTCRLCSLATCPQDRCPVEHRYREFAGDGDAMPG